MPAVSITLPTYNRSGMLREAIASVRAQTFTDWELLIIDDGSTDDTQSAVAPFAEQDPRIRYIRQPNMGLGKTRERSIGMCRGEFIAFLDDDDLFLPRKLERQVAFLRAHPEVGMVHSSVEVVDSNERILERAPKAPAREFMDLIDECPVYVVGAMVRAACFERLGTFRADLSISGDHEMWLRISRAYPIAFLPEAAGLYRRHDANMTHDYAKTYEETLKIYRELLAGSLPPGARNRVLAARRRTIAERALRHYQVASSRLAHKRYGDAASSYLKSVQDDPAIGLRVPWGQARFIAYRLLRPYAAAAYCATAATLLRQPRRT